MSHYRINRGKILKWKKNTSYFVREKTLLQANPFSCQFLKCEKYPMNPLNTFWQTNSRRLVDLSPYIDFPFSRFPWWFPLALHIFCLPAHSPHATFVIICNRNPQRALSCTNTSGKPWKQSCHITHIYQYVPQSANISIKHRYPGHLNNAAEQTNT